MQITTSPVKRLWRIGLALFLALAPLVAALPAPASAQTPVPTSTPTAGYVLAPCEWVILGEWWQFGGPWWEAIHGTDLWQTWDGNVITSHDFEGINVDSPPWGLYCDLTEIYNTVGYWPTEVFVETSSYVDNGNPNTGYYGVHPDYSSFQLGGFYQDYDGWAATIYEASGIRQIAWTTSGVGAYIDMLRVYVRYQDLGITPTPIPTATPFAIGGVCIPREQAYQPTPTVMPRTPTPFGTRTPGPTNTPAPAPTIIPGFSIRTDFDLGLAPLTSNGLATWSSNNGPDGLRGVGYLTFTAANTITDTGSALPFAQSPSDSIVYEVPGGAIPTPWRLAGNARVATDLTSGQYAYLQVFEWRDNGAGTGSWYLAANIRIDHYWQEFMASGGLVGSRVRAVAIRSVFGLGPITNPLGYVPQNNGSGAEIDDLRLGAGSDYANSPTLMGLPVCSAEAPKPAGTEETRICTVKRIGIDVFQRCEKPESLLEIGGWINYLWCAVSTYFTFLPENGQQITELRDRQALNEPAGTLIESGSALIVVNDALVAFRDRNSSAPHRRFDWNIFSTFDLANPLPSIPILDPSAPLPESTCDLSDIPIQFSDTQRLVACQLLTLLNDSPLLPALQFLIDLMPAVALLGYVFSHWVVSHGSKN